MVVKVTAHLVARQRSGWSITVETSFTLNIKFSPLATLRIAFILYPKHNSFLTLSTLPGCCMNTGK